MIVLGIALGSIGATVLCRLAYLLWKANQEKVALFTELHLLKERLEEVRALKTDMEDFPSDLCGMGYPPGLPCCLPKDHHSIGGCFSVYRSGEGVMMYQDGIEATGTVPDDADVVRLQAWRFRQQTGK